MTRMDDIDREIRTLKQRAECARDTDDTMVTMALLAIAEVLIEMNMTLTYIKRNMRRREDE